MKICNFIQPELDEFRKLCNFTPEEREYFELKATDMSNVEISMQMNISEAKVSVLAKKVKSKILRVIH